MTGNDAPPAAGGGAHGSPPWPLELLADLHAGLLDPATAAELRRQVDADPDASATLAALDATTAALADLPPLRIPDDVAARIDAALRDEAAARVATAVRTEPAPPAAPAPPVAPVTDLGAARERRRRRGLMAGAGLLAAAAAVFGVVFVSGLPGGDTTGTARPTATNASDQVQPPLAISSDNLGDALGETMAMSDYGPLGSPGRLDACLTAIQVDPADKPLGAREVELDGEPGVLLILPTGTAARFRLVVVAPECGPGQPVVMADTTIGR